MEKNIIIVEVARLTESFGQIFFIELKMLEASFICLLLISSVSSTLESLSLDEPLSNRKTKRYLYLYHLYAFISAAIIMLF